MKTSRLLKLFAPKKKQANKTIHEMNEYEELDKISENLTSVVQEYTAAGWAGAVEKLEKVIFEVNKSFSNSWLGYHSCVYYKDLLLPPAGEFFDSLQMPKFDYFSSEDNWVAYQPDAIREFILQQCGIASIEGLLKYGKETRKKFEDYKIEVLSIFSGGDHNTDSFIADSIKKAKSLVPLNSSNVIRQNMPTQMRTCDYTALGQGWKIPPHFALLAEIVPVQSTIDSCAALSRIAKTCASHIRRQPEKIDQKKQGDRIFIGHGRSDTWRDLKDFLNDRLELPWDEFNRVPVAGVTNIYRLGQMLDNACFAFLIMTAEDELADGDMQARMNVIHEAGLFQGRLGFERAIILLEEGCKEFSNINGLGQIRFPKGNIKMAFEQIRAVLEREEII